MTGRLLQYATATSAVSPIASAIVDRHAALLDDTWVDGRDCGGGVFSWHRRGLEGNDWPESVL